MCQSLPVAQWSERAFHARDRTSFTKGSFVIQIREIASRFGASTSCDADKGLHLFKAVEKAFNLKKSRHLEHSYVSWNSLSPEV